jgi:signal transduction histidine kinase/CheY-like chemotaxis protein
MVPDWSPVSGVRRVPPHQLRQALEILEQSESRLRALVLASSEVLFSMSPDWDTILELYRPGVGNAESPKNSWFQEYVHPDDQELFRNVCAEAVRTKSVFHLEHRDRRKTGGWVLTRAVPILDANGAIIEWFGAVQDTTDAHRYQEALVAADQASQRKSEFLATLAHELRNPLAAIQLSVQLLQGHDADSQPQAVWGVLERQVGHLSHLVHGVLDVARLDQGVLALNKTPTELSAVVRGALDIAMPSASQAGLTVIVSLPEQPVVLDADPVRLVQVLANLLDNACKFTRAGGAVEVRAESLGDVVEVSVRDTGDGLAPDALPRLFDLFWKGPDGNGQAGLGIGLTLVMSIIELHGGSVDVHSDGPGYGTTFVVRLPVAHAAPGEGTAGDPTPRAESAQRVLIVDDNHDLLDVLATAVRQMGMDVATAADGRQVLELMRSFKPTVAILDLGMAPLDGYQVAQLIRQSAEGRAVPLIALTGWGSQADVDRVASAGFAHHLLKPITVEQLQDLLMSVQPFSE